MNLSPEERTLLDRPLVAQLATIMPDGSPHLTTIWHHRDEDTIRMVCDATALKARNIRRDPRVAINVVDIDNPYRYIQIRGTAELVADSVKARDELRALANRYMGSVGDAFVDMYPADVDQITIIIHPKRVSLTVSV
ncbi:MAG TPA: PPOX class F420-dependent oxidoreductase [Thermomicrobiales bacterium]|nr:PPOX class F420-dependent oxidoreductase [Thermomicrobiales bacterium]